MTAGASEPRPTREALSRLAAAVQVLRQSRLPDLPGSARAVAELGAAERAPKEPGQAHLDEARATITSVAGDFDRVPDRQMREAPWLLWTATVPLAGLPGLLDTVEAMAGQRGSVRRKLIEAWLIGFAPNALRIEEGGRMIRRLLAASPDARLDVWREADRTLALFDARLGPARVAAALLTPLQSVEVVLREAGLDDTARAGGGFARAVQGEVLAQFVGALQSRPPAEVFSRCAAFLAPDGRLRFDDPASRGAVARGLLEPWLDRTAPPAQVENCRAEIQGFLLRLLGDPRIRPQGWMAAGEAATTLMRRWLDVASFEAFFELIGEYSPEEQFEYRKAFWAAYLDRRAISRIWIALGGQVHSSARAVRELNGAYGRLSGASATDAVLLMQAGEVVLCEWSRIGKLRAWKRTGRSAPRLDLPNYEANALRSEGMNFPAGQPWRRIGIQRNLKGTADGQGLRHDGPAKGYWQTSAAEFMRRHTGLDLGPDDWMPK